MKTLYHIRTATGVSIDLTDAPRHTALETARKEHAEVYELKGHIATRIYTPPAIKPVEL